MALILWHLFYFQTFFVEITQIVGHHSHGSSSVSTNVNEIAQLRSVEEINPNPLTQYSNLHQLAAPPGDPTTAHDHTKNITGHVPSTGSGPEGHMMPHVTPPGGVITDQSHAGTVYGGLHPVQQEVVPGGHGGPIIGPSSSHPPGQMPPYWFMGGHYQEPEQQ